MDLRQQFPRSIREMLGGYVHFARMIDKGRAALTNSLGDYIFPCPLDHRLLDFWGLSSDKFLTVVEGRSQSGIQEWIMQNTISHTPQEIEDWNTAQLARGPDTQEKLDYFHKTRDAIDPTRTDISTWADLLDLDENRHVPLKMASPLSAQ